MNAVTITLCDDQIASLLQERAEEHGVSPEAEANNILHDALFAAKDGPGRAFLERVRARFAPLGLTVDELDIPPRHAYREPPRYD
jgi:plasmid stability protein